MTTPDVEIPADDQAASADPDAPYGRRSDGTPKRGPGGRPPRAGGPSRPQGKRSRLGGANPYAAPAPPKRSARSARKTKGSEDYRPGLVGLASIVALPLRFVSPVDSATVLAYAPELAEAINETAKDVPQVAALCDRLLQVGPYGLIIGVALKIGAQVAENHGWAPAEVTRKLGAVPRDVLMAQLAAQAGAAEATQRDDTPGEPLAT